MNTRALAVLIVVVVLLVLLVMTCGLTTSYTFETNIPIPTEIVP